jgi:lipoprotein NlpI
MSKSKFRAAAFVVVALPATSAFADAASECGDWEKTLPDRSLIVCSEVIRSDPRAAWAYNNRCLAYDIKGEYDRAIADCDQAIRLDPHSPQPYYNRGNVYKDKDDYDRAIADYSEALRVDPKYASAYNNRGSAYNAKRDYDRAIADYNEVIRLDPKDVAAYANRRRARFYQGDFADAAADLLRPNDLKTEAYATLWGYLARERAGGSGSDELTANATRLPSKDWPYPVIDFCLGRRSQDEMLLAAINAEQRCAAQFYVGEWLLLKGNRTEAVAQFREAEASCKKGFYEYAGTVAELKRLAP